MKKLFAVAALVAGFSAPALAQHMRVQVEEGRRGPVAVETVRHHPGHHYGWRHNRGHRCRVVTTRTVRPSGAVVVRQVRRCR